MKNIFRENKLIYRRLERDDDKDQMGNLAKGMDEGKYENAQQARRVAGIQSGILDQLDKADVISDREKEQMTRRVEIAGRNAVSETEMKQIKSEVEGKLNESRDMYGNYSRQTEIHIGRAWSKEESDKLNQDFKESTREDKRILLSAIVSKATKLLDSYNALVKEDPTLGAKILSWKIDEREMRANNIIEYKALLEKDREHFSNDTLRLFIEEFVDLKTTAKQQDYLDQYKKEAEKRKKCTRSFKQFSLERQRTHSKFWEMPRTTKNGQEGKEEHLEVMEKELSTDFEQELKSLPGITKEEIKFGIAEFKRINSMKEREARLAMCPTFIKAQKEIQKSFEKQSEEMDLLLPEDIKPNKKYSQEAWKKARFEDKDKMVRDLKDEIKWLKKGLDLLDKHKKAGTINRETYIHYFQGYVDMDIVSKMTAYSDFNKNMKRREKVAEDYKDNLDKSVQAKFKTRFEKADLFEDRRAIYDEAVEYQAAQASKDGNIQTPKNTIEQKEQKPEIKALLDQAQLLEKSDKVEQAIGIYKSILIIEQSNALAKRNLKRLEKQSSENDVPDDIALERSLLEEAGSEADERFKITLTSELLEEKKHTETVSGTSDSTKQQGHLADKFEQELDSAIAARTGNKKRLARSGKIDNVTELDAENLGKTDGDENKIYGYRNKLRASKGKAQGDKVENITVVNRKSGKEESTQVAEVKLKDRQERLKEKLVARTQKKLKKKKKAVDQVDELRARREKEALKRAVNNADLEVDLAA